MAGSFGEAIENKRIIVCVGSGGVGKTTTAASFAIETARRGKRALVLTIDPAKRLADSLGLKGLEGQLRHVMGGNNVPMARLGIFQYTVMNPAFVPAR